MEKYRQITTYHMIGEDTFYDHTIEDGAMILHVK